MELVVSRDSQKLTAIHRGVFDAGLAQGFDTFAAGTAFAAVMLSSFVTRIGLAVIEAHFFPAQSNLRFCQKGVGGENGDIHVCAC